MDPLSHPGNLSRIPYQPALFEDDDFLPTSGLVGYGTAVALPWELYFPSWLRQGWRFLGNLDQWNFEGFRFPSYESAVKHMGIDWCLNGVVEFCWEVSNSDGNETVLDSHFGQTSALQWLSDLDLIEFSSSKSSETGECHRCDPLDFNSLEV